MIQPDIRMTDNELNEILRETVYDIEHRIYDRQCIVTAKLPNGFIITGQSTCIDPKDYDEELSVEIAKKIIKDKLYQLNGFTILMKEWQERTNENPNLLLYQLPFDNMVFKHNIFGEKYSHGTFKAKNGFTIVTTHRFSSVGPYDNMEYSEESMQVILTHKALDEWLNLTRYHMMSIR